MFRGKGQKGRRQRLEVAFFYDCRIVAAFFILGLYCNPDYAPVRKAYSRPPSFLRLSSVSATTDRREISVRKALTSALSMSFITGKTLSRIAPCSTRRMILPTRSLLQSNNSGSFDGMERMSVHAKSLPMLFPVTSSFAPGACFLPPDSPNPLSWDFEQPPTVPRFGFPLLSAFCSSES